MHSVRLLGARASRVAGSAPRARGLASSGPTQMLPTWRLLPRARAPRVAGSAHARGLASSGPPPAFDLPQVRQELFQFWTRSEAATERSRAPRQAMYCMFTLADAERAYLADGAQWHWLDREMSSNVAGETGAVAIYRGALDAMAARRLLGAPLPPAALEFATSHMAAESRHLRLIESVVPPSKRTRLLPIWRLAGWSLGFAPTLLGGERALFRTVDAVETFVEEHYNEQIGPLLRAEQPCPELVRLLSHCCAEEVEHREDAAARLRGAAGAPPAAEGLAARAWKALVKAGSRVAAELARRV